MGYSGPTRFRPGGVLAGAVRGVERPARVERRGSLDWGAGRRCYFTEMYQLLNALRKMQLAPRSRIVEAGAGAGWATEILASLRYRVDCVEPSAALIEAAKTRVRARLEHQGQPGLMANVAWQCATIEESDLSEGEVDAVLFFESFHRVVDERRALDKAFAALRPGGWLMILGDLNWTPGDTEQEAELVAQMNAFGASESPLTHDYMVWLLKDRGFTDVTRHHAVNTLVPMEAEGHPVRDFVDLDAAHYNLVSARKGPVRTEAFGPAAAAPPPPGLVRRAWRAFVNYVG